MVILVLQLQYKPVQSFSLLFLVDMAEEVVKEKALGTARASLNGKTDLERTAILHQHIGSRAMGDMVIETIGSISGW